MNKRLTLGSLFDGSGGFPLGAVFSGIAPVWASEIEPLPIRVTSKRFPGMKQYGDISAMAGAMLEPVDIITFGSPCTNLSVAGKREGLDGKQSSLFYQAIRIVKEMRQATNGKYPRYIVWENVPGAFSSNKGADFHSVLESIVQIAEPEATVPTSPEKGWPYADILLGDGWSLAYRTIDAQYFGVAQRRKRIYLVADFAGERAGEILFERTGVQRDFEPGFEAWEEAARGAQGSAHEPVHVLNDQGGACMNVADNHTATLRAQEHGHQPIVFEPGAASRLGGHVWEDSTGALRADAGDNRLAVAIENHPADNRVDMLSALSVQPVLMPKSQASSAITAFGICSGESNAMRSPNPHSGIYEADTARTLDQSGGNPACNQGGIAVCVQGSLIGRDERNGPNGLGVNEDTAFTLNTADRHAVAYAMTTGSFAEIHEEQTATLVARDYKDPQVVNASRYLVRRLTPLECCRLQGFPDWWCAGLETEAPTEAEIDWWAEVFEAHRKIMGIAEKPKSRTQLSKWLKSPCSDSAEYKMWGNGVSLPCVCFVLRGIVLNHPSQEK